MASRLRTMLPPVVAVLLLLIGWQLAVVLLKIEPWQLPSPLAIAKELGSNWARLWMHTEATLRLTLLGFAAGASAGVVLAALLHLIPGARAAIAPLLVLSQNVPSIVLGPLLIMWLGTDLAPKLVLIMLICFFPIVVSMLGGLASSDARLVNYMQMIGAGKWRIFRHVELPSAIPALFSGLKISVAYSVTGAVVAEWLGASRGLGYFIRLSSNGFKMTSVFAGIVLIIALCLLMFIVVAGCERLAVRWRTSGEAVKS